MKVRLRPKHSLQKLEEIYRRPHDFYLWDDHITRAGVTVIIGDAMIRHFQPAELHVIDLSCGNGEIARWFREEPLVTKIVLGDYAPGYGVTGPIEDTILLFDYSETPESGMLILSETLEHLDKPEALLEEAAKRFQYLLMSTPIAEDVKSSNLEHYWSWEVPDVEKMLQSSGWEVTFKNELYLPTVYDYMILGCVSR